MLIYYQPAVTK